MSDWQRTGSGLLRRYLTDGTQIVVSGCQWDLTLPGGKHVRGTAANEEAAKVAWQSDHDQYVLSQWKQGKMGRGGLFICPLG